jgi:ribosomal protein S27AE
MPDEPVFVEPSAAGPSQKLVPNDDGTTHVVPGKSHEAREGKVSNPGVRSLGSGLTDPRCPHCGESSLKMHMNKPVGKRIFCTKCPYDQAKEGGRINTINQDVNIVGQRGNEGKGVNIIRGRTG